MRILQDTICLCLPVRTCYHKRNKLPAVMISLVLALQTRPLHYWHIGIVNLRVGMPLQGGNGYKWLLHLRRKAADMSGAFAAWNLKRLPRYQHMTCQIGCNTGLTASHVVQVTCQSQMSICI